MKRNDWEGVFLDVFERGTAAWKAGRRSPETMFAAPDVAFLQTLGCSAQELFDFVDDAQRYGEPDAATALAVQAIRREYFLGVLGGKATGNVASMDDLPAKTDAVDGIPWLPRIIAKARLKLRGEMPADLMYGCGGDREFLRRVRMALPQFLELVRDSGADDRQIIEAVKRSARLRSESLAAA
ncbi:MAG: DUF5069 domain-containing protein [Verrucomicrobiae bacterium]|nr:DUF5069 domain-containing protein [Verrucomicrobiae bacterium]